MRPLTGSTGRNEMKKVLMVLTAGMLLMSANVFAEMDCCKAGDCAMGKGGMHGEKDKDCKKMKKMDKELNLTAEQSAQIDAIRAACRTDCEQRAATLETARQAKMEAMKKTPPDFAAAKAKTQEIDALMTQNKLAMLDMQEKVYAVLTPEQQEKHSKMMAEKKEKKQGKHCDKKSK